MGAQVQTGIMLQNNELNKASGVFIKKNDPRKIDTSELKKKISRLKLLIKNGKSRKEILQKVMKSKLMTVRRKMDH